MDNPNPESRIESELEEIVRRMRAGPTRDSADRNEALESLLTLAKEPGTQGYVVIVTPKGDWGFATLGQDDEGKVDLPLLAYANAIAEHEVDDFLFGEDDPDDMKEENPQ